MAKQINISDLIPNELKTMARDFLDEEYNDRHHRSALPQIRTRYEAYGKMSEALVNTMTAVDGIKAGMRDCLNALASNDGTYRQAAEETYNALLDTFMVVAEFAVQTLNCVYQIEEKLLSAETPLETLARENLDDTGSENTDAELPDSEEEDEADGE